MLGVAKGSKLRSSFSEVFWIQFVVPSFFYGDYFLIMIKYSS